MIHRSPFQRDTSPSACRRIIQRLSPTAAGQLGLDAISQETRSTPEMTLDLARTIAFCISVLEPKGHQSVVIATTFGH